MLATTSRDAGPIDEEAALKRLLGLQVFEHACFTYTRKPEDSPLTIKNYTDAAPGYLTGLLENSIYYTIIIIIKLTKNVLDGRRRRITCTSSHVWHSVCIQATISHTSFESLFASFELAANLSTGISFTLALPLEYYHLPYATNVIDTFGNEYHSRSTTLLLSTAQDYCLGPVAFVSGTAYTHFCHTSFQSLLPRRLMLSSCLLDDDVKPANASVLVYERDPSVGSHRRFLNLDSLIAAFTGAGITVQHSFVPHHFCDQVKLLHANYSLVITDHGAHETLFFALDPGTTVIEVMPQCYFNTMMCEPARGIGFKHYTFASNPALQRLTVRDWCAQTTRTIWMVTPGCTPDPSLGANTMFQHSEIQALVSIAANITRGGTVQSDDSFDISEFKSLIP